MYLSRDLNGLQFGWIPKQIITFAPDLLSGIILKEYSAKELSVAILEKVKFLESLNGWILVKNCKTNNKVWIPFESVQK